jgi:transketolase
MTMAHAILPKIYTEGSGDLPRVLRGALVALSHAKNVPHLGSTLSCIDIMIAAYWHTMNFDPKNPKDPARDRFILSKGHAAKALYVCLAYRGFFEIELLQQLGEDGSPLAEHPGPNSVPGVEAATGSLGHGLPIGLGHALAARIKELNYRVFVLMSDGECNEGSVWEAAMMAAGQSVGNLTTIIDYNKWQATGRSDDVLQLAPLADKWRAFGWDVCEIDGHDIEVIKGSLNTPSLPTGRPHAVIAHTVKGKGVSFMEDDNNWHYRIPNTDEVALAFQELGLS